METAPMAGKSWQASHEPPCRREGRHPSHGVNSGKEGGKWGRGEALKMRSHELKIDLPVKLKLKTSRNLT